VLLWGLFVGAAAAVLAPMGPGALVPLKMAVAAADSVGSDVYVAVVVDFGNGTTKTYCVPVASKARDTDALAAAVGTSNVSYSSSGLLCAINGYPSDGVQNCGQSVGNGDYDFWSYWHGSSGQWSYAENGPAGQSVSNPADDVEGWKFQNSEPASSNDPPPGVAPSYTQICNASTEVPPAQTTTATGGASGAPTGSVSSSGTTGSTPTTAAAPAGSGGATPTTSPVTSRSMAGIPTSSTTTTGAAGAGAAAGTTTTSISGGSSGAESGSHGSSDARRIADASASAHESSGGSSSDVLPGVLVGVVVVGLATFALVRWRRRPAEE
jgi:hypothetical protein